MNEVRAWLIRATGIGYMSPDNIEQSPQFKSLKSDRQKAVDRAASLADGLQLLQNELEAKNKGRRWQ